MAKRKATRETSAPKRDTSPGALDYGSLIDAIAAVHSGAQSYAARAVNVGLTLRNWLIGYHIVEYEQHGSDRAKYGERLLEALSKDLRRLGRGFGWRNLEMFRRFYLRYPIPQSLISQSLIAKSDAVLSPSADTGYQPLDWQDDAYFTRLFQALTWTHFIELTRIDDPLKRAFYEIETIQSGWSVRELKR